MIFGSLDTAAGTYTVTLTVTGPGGRNTKTRANYITVTPAPNLSPVADFFSNPVSGKAPLNVRFTDHSSGTITGWSWIFGGGEEYGTESNAQVHLFRQLYGYSDRSGTGRIEY